MRRKRNKLEDPRNVKLNILLDTMRSIAGSETIDANELRALAKKCLRNTYGSRKKKTSGHSTVPTYKNPNSRKAKLKNSKKSTISKTASSKKTEAQQTRSLKQLEPNEPSPVKNQQKTSKKQIKKNKTPLGPRVLPALGQSKKPGSHRNQS
ncbi:MAG: hypothetical protein RLN78_04030 [Phycisphaerales bacterium]